MAPYSLVFDDHDAHAITLLTAGVALVAFACFALLGLLLRHCAHTIREEQMVKLMRLLLVAMSITVGAPVVRWLSLLLYGASLHDFGVVVVPVMAATSLFQAMMINSWVTFRMQLSQEESVEEEEPALDPQQAAHMRYRHQVEQQLLEDEGYSYHHARGEAAGVCSAPATPLQGGSRSVREEDLAT